MANINIQNRHKFSGHSTGIFDLKPINECEFLSAGGDGQVVKWNVKDLKDGQVVAKVNSTIYAICVDGDRLLVGENSRAMHMIELSSKKVLRSVEIKSLVFSIERVDDYYLVGTGAGELFVFDLEMNFEKRLKISTKSVRSISAKTSDIACCLSDNSVRILDRKTLVEKYKVDGHKLSVFAGVFHPKSDYFLTTGRDAQIKVWDIFNHYEEVKDIPAHMYASNHLVFHPSGKYFATGSMDKTIKIWDGTTFVLLKVIDKIRYDGHTNSVNKLLWMTFENLLVTCSDDRTIAVWDIKFD